MKSLLHDGNEAFREGDYVRALDQYEALKRTDLDYAVMREIEFNTYLAAREHGLIAPIENFNVSLKDRSLSTGCDVIINCWLRNPEPIQDAMVSLYQDLRSRGLNVLVVTHSKPLLHNPQVETMEVDFSLLNTKSYGVTDDVAMPEWLEDEVLSISIARFKHLGRDDMIARGPRVSATYSKGLCVLAEFSRNK